MRLYVNTKEVPFLKNALRSAIDQTESQVCSNHLEALLERVVLCEELQKSERRTKNNN